jgi:hydrogenase/urease accessory protein HupE
LDKSPDASSSARELLMSGMGTNLPTILPMLRFWAIILACVLTTISAQAHPGHEGGHDGDEFVWTADHLARHPGATLLVLAAVALIAWGAFRFCSATQRQLKAAAARTQAADKSA